MSSPQPQGSRWFVWLRSPIYRTGLLVGVQLSAVLVAWLIIANRVPALAAFAGMRNAAAAVLAGLFMLIPVVRFLRKPGPLFASGIVAWLVLSLAYFVMGFIFERLHTRMSPFHLFMLGAVIYGAVAAFAWVASLVLTVRQHHHSIATARRRAS